MREQRVWRVAIVDGSKEGARRLRRYFEDLGAVVYPTSRPNEALGVLESFMPQAVLLTNLPVAAPSVCRELRGAGFYGALVVFVRSGARESERLAAFSEGADDVVSERASLAVVEARLRAILTRSHSVGLVNVRGLVIDFERRLVRHPDRDVGLSDREAAVLRLLVDRRGSVVRREELLDHAWSENRPAPRTVDTHMLHIRKKLSSGPNGPKIIETVHAVGYRFVGGSISG